MIFRLVFQRVEAVPVARDDLDRCDDRGHPHRHGKHHARARQPGIPQQMEGAGRADHERRGEIGGQHHMHEAIGKRGIEDHLEPACGDELSVGVDGIARRRLHPGVRGENPESRDQRSRGDHQRGEEVQSRSHPLEAEQHDAEESRFEEERGQYLVGHQRPDHGAGPVGEGRPVGAELVGHHDAGHDAHAERKGENLQPVIEQVEEHVAAGPEPQGFENREVAGKPDREGREHNMERHCEGELRAGQKHRIPTFEHRRRPLRVDWSPTLSRHPGHRHCSRTKCA